LYSGLLQRTEAEDREKAKRVVLRKGGKLCKNGKCKLGEMKYR
jgi:hypothetical protein